MLLVERPTIRAAATTVPLSRTTIGPPVTLFVMVSVAALVPAARGANVTLMVQLAPADTLPRQLSFSAKSVAFVPLIPKLEIVKAELLSLLSVMACAGAAVPTGLANASTCGERLTVDKSFATKALKLSLGALLASFVDCRALTVGKSVDNALRSHMRYQTDPKLCASRAFAAAEIGGVNQGRVIGIDFGDENAGAGPIGIRRLKGVGRGKTGACVANHVRIAR